MTESSKRFKLIACEVFFREMCICAAQSPHIIDMEFTDKGAHDQSESLRRLVQEKIDQTAASDKNYQAVLLGFGLCGNATLDLTAPHIPLVIPRAHDCCTLFLGSRLKFQQHFADAPSLPFSSAGYIERGDGYIHEVSLNRVLGLDQSYLEYVEKYGEENAKFIWDSLHPVPEPDRQKLVYIEVPETAHLGFAEKCREQAKAENREFILLNGEMRLIRALLFGDWDPAEFLVVQPGQKIGAVYDWHDILRAV